MRLKAGIGIVSAALVAATLGFGGAAGVGAERSAHVIVLLRGPASVKSVAAVSARTGVHVVRRFHSIDGFAAVATQGQLAQLRRLHAVKSVQADAPVTLDESDAQASFGIAAAHIDVPSLDGNADGSPTYSKGDMVAAILDTGIDTTHVDFPPGKVIAFKDFVNGQTTPYDDNGHGTDVASILAGAGNGNPAYRGVAPGAALVIVKVTPADGVARMDNVVAGLDWVIANKNVYNIDAVNLSLGAVGCWDGTEPASQAVNRAVDAGLTVVVAAGNGGPDPCTVKSPGAAAKALTVANMADTGVGGFYLNRDSSRGPTADGRIKPDIAGPGVNIPMALFGSGNGYEVGTGTSMSAPFVTGLVLLMLEAKSTLTPGQIKSTIMSTAQDWGRGGNSTVPGSTGVDSEYGAGRLDAYAALKAIGVNVKTKPVVPAHQEVEGNIIGPGDIWTKTIDVVDPSKPIAATMIIPNASPDKDYDLFLDDPYGNQVAAAQSLTRQERVTFTPTVAGTYTFRVIGYTGSGDFFMDISAGTVVPDSDPPVLKLPADITVNATSPKGAVVTYIATANDAVDGAVTPSCSPASGATIAIGTTTVNCSATDAKGNKATDSFSITVKGALTQLRDFSKFLISKNTKLTSQGADIVDTAAGKLSRGEKGSTCQILSGLLWAIDKTRGQLGADLASQATTTVKRIAAVVGC